MRLFDRLLRIVRPEPVRAAAKRAFFAGAQTGRLVADWIFAPMVSANQELKADLPTLRARARELARNEPLAARYLDLMADNVVGSQGICCEPRVYNRQGDLDEARSEAICEQWEAWGAAGSCTRDGRLSWSGVLRLAVRLRCMDGEGFLELVPDAENPYGLALQFVDADLVDHGKDQQASRTQNAIAMGIELDARGRPARFHTWLDYSRREPRIVNAGWMLHYFRSTRPGQARGYTDFAPVMMSMRMLNGYREAELVASRTAAAKMGWIIDPEDGPAEGAEAVDPSTGTIPVEATPGTFGRLKFGGDFKQWDPQHPVAAFGQFTQSVTTTICAGLNHSYPTLTGDMSGTSFSSGRLGVLGEREHYRAEQQLLIASICDPVFAKWLQMGQLRNQIDLPSGYTVQPLWMPRGYPYVDPEKDLAAIAAADGLGLTSMTREAAMLGLEYDDLLRQRQAERKLRAQFGEAEPNHPDRIAGRPSQVVAEEPAPARLMALA